jgi:antirestriction protein ArdC
MDKHDKAPGRSLYDDVTTTIIAQLEAGCLPWVQPWQADDAAIGIPRNAATGRSYSGINVLILWNALFGQGYETQRWLTYRQAMALGGSVRKGESGTSICYADSFVPKGEDGVSADGEPRRIPFLKRFTVFNIDQCIDLPEQVHAPDILRGPEVVVPQAETLVQATGAEIRIGGTLAYYAPAEDHIHLPRRQLFGASIDYYRTLLHELGHWTGHASRLDRFHGFATIDPQHWYAREELVAEMASAFLCAELGIVPTVRHADYIGAWLAILQEDNRAIFRAASAASKAAQYLMGFLPSQEAGQ